MAASHRLDPKGNNINNNTPNGNWSYGVAAIAGIGAIVSPLFYFNLPKADPYASPSIAGAAIFGVVEAAWIIALCGAFCCKKKLYPISQATAPSALFQPVPTTVPSKADRNPDTHIEIGSPSLSAPRES